MVERISSGATSRPSATAELSDKGGATAGKGKGAEKSGLFSKRAQKEQVAQTRQAGKTANRTANKSVVNKSVVNKSASKQLASKSGNVLSRANSRGAIPPGRPRAPTDLSREARRARLHEAGANLAQHKSASKEAMATHQRDLAQRLEQERGRTNTLYGEGRDLTGKDLTGKDLTKDLTGKDLTGKDVAEVKWATLDQHGMRNKLRQLDEVSAHKAAGRDYKLLQPPPLIERKAVLRATPQGFVGRLGSKIKDTLLRIFRPRQWQARQVELSLARKDELRAVELYAKSLQNKPLDKQLAAMSAAAFREGQRGVNPAAPPAGNFGTISDASVKEAAVKPHIGAPSAYVVAYDEGIQRDPRYLAEKAVLDKGIDGLRKEMEGEAKRNINEALAREQARGKGGETTPATTPAPAPAPAAQEVRGKEIRGDGTEGDNLARRDSVKNPHATSL